jgi:hypothetical protein
MASESRGVHRFCGKCARSSHRAQDDNYALSNVSYELYRTTTLLFPPNLGRQTL